MSFVRRLIATVFFSGYFPVASGTVGTAATIPFVVLIWWVDNLLVHVAAIIVVTLAGLWSAADAEKTFRRKDPGQVVIDEAAGYLIATLAAPPSWGAIVVSFFLFRFFDVSKLWPASRLERLPGAKGIMCDDLVAGLYALVCLHAGLWWLGDTLAFGSLF